MNRPSFILAALPLLLVSCGSPSTSLSRVEESVPSSSMVSSSDAESSSIPKAGTKSGDVSEGYRPFVEKYLAKLNSFQSYKSVTKGSTKSKVAFIETSQSIDVTSIKGEYCYLKNESHGVVDAVHEAYFHQNDVMVKNLGDSEFQKKTKNEYLDAYGVDPYGYNIEGYSIGDGAILSITKESEGNVYKITFDNEKATNNVRIQMKAFGGLDDYPVFSKIEVFITIEDDFTPVKYKVQADYTAKKFVDTGCHQEYEVTFSDFNKDIEIPDLAKIRSTYSF